MALTFTPDTTESCAMPRPTDEDRSQWIADYMNGQHCVRLTIPLFNVTQLKELIPALKALAAELQAIHDDKQTANGWKVIWARNAIKTTHRKLKGGEHYKGAR